MGKCENCKYLTSVDRHIAPKGWCPIWEEWQNVTAKPCKFMERKDFAAAYAEQHAKLRNAIPPRGVRRIKRY